jgi:hypothetical protein
MTSLHRHEKDPMLMFPLSRLLQLFALHRAKAANLQDQDQSQLPANMQADRRITSKELDSVVVRIRFQTVRRNTRVEEFPG